MNYLKIYFSIIANAAGRKPSIIYDKHHIIPKSLGGPDLETNWIYLTPKEHIVAHRLLAKAYPNVEILQSGFNAGTVSIKYYNQHKWMMRVHDLTSDILYSRNRKKIMEKLRILMEALGDDDLDSILPVKPQPTKPKVIQKVIIKEHAEPKQQKVQKKKIKVKFKKKPVKPAKTVKSVKPSKPTEKI